MAKVFTVYHLDDILRPTLNYRFFTVYRLTKNFKRPVYRYVRYAKNTVSPKLSVSVNCA